MTLGNPKPVSDTKIVSDTTKTATLSPDGRYRYALGRRWADSGRRVLFVMLNPSTADATSDDPTIGRCVGFARAWGRDGLIVVNLYAYRATDPAALAGLGSVAVGPENDRYLRAYASTADLVVAAWGASLPADGGDARAEHVLGILRDYADVHHLGLTKAGRPRHPLYLRGDTTPTLWQPRIRV